MVGLRNTREYEQRWIQAGPPPHNGRGSRGLDAPTALRTAGLSALCIGAERFGAARIQAADKVAGSRASPRSAPVGLRDSYTP